MTARCAASASPYRSPRRPSSAVDPSMSLKSIVTVPAGSSRTPRLSRVLAFPPHRWRKRCCGCGMWGCGGPGGMARVAEQGQGEPGGHEHGLRGSLGGAAVRGDQRGGHDGDAERRAGEHRAEPRPCRYSVTSRTWAALKACQRPTRAPLPAGSVLAPASGRSPPNRICVKPSTVSSRVQSRCSSHPTWTTLVGWPPAWAMRVQPGLVRLG